MTAIPIAALPLAAPRWSTSSFSPDTPTSPPDQSLLGEHLDHCQGAHGRLVSLQCVAETLDAFLSARLITTLVAAALLMGTASLLV